MADKKKKTDDGGAEVSTSVRFVVNEATAAQIVDDIRRIDADAAEFVDTNDIPLRALRDYATNPAYKTLADGRRVKVRGPLAQSLEAYLDGIIRIGKLRWESVLDENTGEVDRELNGKIFNAEDYDNLVLPPLHPNCRCRLVPLTGKIYR